MSDVSFICFPNINISDPVLGAKKAKLKVMNGTSKIK